MKYTYRNKVTGAVISVPCALTGVDWEQVTERAKAPSEGAKTPVSEKKPAARKKVTKGA